MSSASDFADSVREFNAMKAEFHQAIAPATIAFEHTGDTEYAVAFGETDNDGQLHESGQGIQNHRIGVVEFPFTASFTPALAMTFTVISAAQQPALVGLRYQVERVISSPSEGVVKCYCRRRET
ncbi:MAG TPA: hypothetical protein VG817_04390 [Gemmatimonadales bacterium]|nr:hypothetical protein [Gemmatimonadales bacterium]